MSYSDDVLYKTLYFCENSSCGRYYVLAVAVDTPAQKCPRVTSHGYMTMVDDRARCWGWETCGNEECECYLWSVVNTTKGKCAKCKQSVVTVSKLNVEDLSNYGEDEDSDDLPKVLRTAKSGAKEHKGWDTGHHSSYTSEGVRKKGGSTATEKHTKADHSDRLVRQKKVETLNGLLTELITWKLKYKGKMSPTLTKKYMAAVGDLRRQISALKGTSVTESSVKSDLGLDDDEEET